MFTIKSENLEKSASYSQRRALYYASLKLGEPKDFRNVSLTMKQADELIKEYNKKIGVTPVSSKVKKQSLESEFIAYMRNTAIPEIIETAKGAMNIKAIVQNDTNFVKDDGKRFLMLGFGCAFVWLDFDKRSKKGKEIYELARDLRNSFTKDFERGFDKKVLDYYKKMGCPLSALYIQDEHVQRTYFRYVANFMEQKGCKNVYVRSRLD